MFQDASCDVALIPTQLRGGDGPNGEMDELIPILGPALLARREVWNTPRPTPVPARF